MKTICVVTGTRAEYGLLKPLLKKIEADEELILKLVVTGMHLSTEFGYTVNEIEEDGFAIDRKIEMLLSADTESAIVKSMGIEMIGFSDYFQDSRPDLIVLLGDRYEILMAAAAAMIFRIPIAHIHGGELTEGVIDEAIRHSITKMSMLHFVTIEEYKKRIIQLGENPDNVFCVGSLGVESIHKIDLLSREKLEDEIKIKFDMPVAMVTYHPVTLEQDTSKEQFERLLKVLDENKEFKFIFTKANSDTDGRVINELIDEFVAKRKDRCVAFASMGQLRYLSSLQYCQVVIGNSSSGIIEVPSFQIPTINIGDRQRGRVQAATLINCGTEEKEIQDAITLAMCQNFREKLSQVKNPYDKEGTSDEIVKIIKIFLNKEKSLKKQFCDL